MKAGESYITCENKERICELVAAALYSISCEHHFSTLSEISMAAV